LEKIFSGRLSFTLQVGEASTYPKRSEEDGKIDFQTMDMMQVYNLVRATTRPYPGAFAHFENRKMRIWKARPFDQRITYPGEAYGKIVEKFDSGFVINCLGGLLIVEDWEYLE